MILPSQRTIFDAVRPQTKSHIMWYVYLLKSKVNGKNYIGITTDLAKRLKQHNSGKTKSIKAFIPYVLIGYKEFTSKTEARKYEIRLKKSYLAKQEFIMAVSSNG